MALSMDEQRMLAEIERRLSAEDPGLAVRLSSFRRPGPAARLRSPRGRILGSLFTVALVAVVSMMVYAMVPFRAHSPKTTTSPQASSPGVSAPAHPGPSGGPAPAGKVSAPAAVRASTSTVPRTSASKTAAVKTSASKTAASKTGASRPGTNGHSASAVKTVARTTAPALNRT